MKLKVGDLFEISFRFSQDEVIAFAKLTGDANPIHLDPVFAAQTPFKKPIIHGMLSATIFSKILGMDFPGNGSIYLKQNLEFLRPMYVEQEYIAKVNIVSIDTNKQRAILSTQILDLQTQKTTIKGEAEVANKELFI